MNGHGTICKYWNPHMNTVLEYCRCLYKIDGCGAGGSLHILLDDDNYDTDSVVFCLKECLAHPEKEESELGRMICEEFLKMSIKERILFLNVWTGRVIRCEETGKVNCEDCEEVYDWLSDYDGKPTK